MPCTMVCLTPVIVGAWPTILSCLVGAASALGLAVAASTKEEEADVAAQTNSAEIELENSSVLECSQAHQARFVREGLGITVETNERGRLVVRVEGHESQESLRQKAQGFAGAVAQHFAYHRAITQLRQAGFAVVEEQMSEDRAVHVTLRRWE